MRSKATPAGLPVRLWGTRKGQVWGGFMKARLLFLIFISSLSTSLQVRKELYSFLTLLASTIYSPVTKKYLQNRWMNWRQWQELLKDRKANYVLWPNRTVVQKSQVSFRLNPLTSTVLGGFWKMCIYAKTKHSFQKLFFCTKMNSSLNSTQTCHKFVILIQHTFSEHLLPARLSPLCSC